MTMYKMINTEGNDELLELLSETFMDDLFMDEVYVDDEESCIATLLVQKVLYD